MVCSRSYTLTEMAVLTFEPRSPSFSGMLFLLLSSQGKYAYVLKRAVNSWEATECHFWEFLPVLVIDLFTNVY